MTGQHTGRTHIRGNDEYPLRAQDIIIPEFLKKEGVVHYPLSASSQALLPSHSPD
jgi:hypothetical protein